MAGNSKKAIYAALFGNLGIAITKFIAAIMTGSAAMWAESYHSASDTVNQLVLLFGIKQSKKAHSFSHQFGYSKAQFFWSFIVAAMIFGISGILSLEHGISLLLDNGEHSPEDPTINYIVLMVAFVFEVNALRIAIKQINESIKSKGRTNNVKSFLQELKESKDASILTVIVEDTAALAGIGVAALGIFLTSVTGDITYDAISSVIIGIILMIFAFFLAKENKDLLIGESITKREYNEIAQSVMTISEVKRIVTMRTMHLGPEDVIIGIQVNLIDDLDTNQIEHVIDNIKKTIMNVLPNLNEQHLFVELER